jgi:hypothetical protein
MDDYAGIWYDEDADFNGLCEEINGKFADFLTERGFTAHIQDFAALGTGDAPEGFAHTVTVTDGFVYDFTYRQIDPEASIPVIVPLDEWVGTWRPAGQVNENPQVGYKMVHTAPTSEYGAVAFNMDGGDIFPKDFYTHPHYYATGFTEADTQTFAALNTMRGNPDALVTVYRAAPVSAAINPGDWVTLSKAYAQQHAMLNDDPADDMPVHAVTVRAKDLYSAGDVNEFGWTPAGTQLMGGDLEGGGGQLGIESLVGLGRAWPTADPHPVTGWRRPLDEAVLPDGRSIRVESSGDGVGRYEYNGRFEIFENETNQRMGYLDYEYSGDKTEPVLIAMVKVDDQFRGQHVADVLAARLAEEFPQGAQGGMLTDDGAAWWPGVAKRMGWAV